jgi:hypothetical protein
VLNGVGVKWEDWAVILNWGLALKGAAAAGATLFAWKKLGVNTRGELRLRAACAGSALLGNPVAYRVFLAKSGPGPGIEVRGGPSTVSHCNVIGVQGDGFNMIFDEPLAGESGAAEDDEDGWDGDEQEEADDGGAEVSDSELTPQPNVVPAVCEDGHASWPGRFVKVYDTSVYSAITPTAIGSCPECGKPRVILAGEYRAGADRFVARTELA